MLRTIVACGAVVLAMMAGVKHGVVRFAGLAGSCSVSSTATDGTQLVGCRPGRLEGAPDLSGHGCTVAGSSGPYAYWRCPAPVVSRLGT